MGWFSSDDHQEAYDQYNSAPPHEAHLSHELIAGAAAFEAAKAYEDHCKANGQPANHALAKELVAGFAGVALDRLIETKGLDAWDDHKRKKALDHAQDRLGFSETVNETVSYSENQY